MQIAPVPALLEVPFYSPKHPKSFGEWSSIHGTTAHNVTITGNWPRLLTQEQLCAYLNVCTATLAKICRVPPIDLGANVLRWNREHIDSWIDSCPPRKSRAYKRPTGSVIAPEIIPVGVASDQRRDSAVSRARARTRKKQ